MLTSADILMKIQTRFILIHAHFLYWDHRCNQSPDEISIRIRNDYATRSSTLRLLVEDFFSSDDIQNMTEEAWKYAQDM